MADLSLSADVERAISDLKRVTAEINRLGNAAEGLKGKTAGMDTGSFSRMADQLTKLSGSATTASTAFSGLAGQQTLFSAFASNFSNNFSLMHGSMGRAIAGASSFGLALGALGGVLAATVAIDISRWIVSMVTSFVAGTLEMTRVTVGFEAALKSVYFSIAEAAGKPITLDVATDKAKADLQYVKDLTYSLGQPLEAAAEGFRKFAASAALTGVPMTQIKTTFQQLSEVATVLHIPEAAVKRMYLAIEQMYSKGKIMSEELRRQLGDVLPGVVNDLAAAMGVTTGQLQKMLQEGKVGTENIAKMVEHMHGRFASGLAGVLDSPIVAIGRLENAWQQVQQSFGEGFWMNMSGVINSFANSLQSNGILEFFRAVGQVLAFVATNVGRVIDLFAAAASVIGSIMSISNNLVEMLFSLGKAAGAFVGIDITGSRFFNFLTVSLPNAINNGVQLITDKMKAITDAANKSTESAFAEQDKQIAAHGEALGKEYDKALSNAMPYIVGFAVDVKNRFSQMVTETASDFARLGKMIKSGWESSDVRGGLKSFYDWMISEAKIVWGQAGDIAAAAAARIKGIWEYLGGKSVEKFFSDAAKGAEEYLDKIKKLGEEALKADAAATDLANASKYVQLREAASQGTLSFQEMTAALDEGAISVNEYIDLTRAMGKSLSEIPEFLKVASLGADSFKSIRYGVEATDKYKKHLTELMTQVMGDKSKAAAFAEEWLGLAYAQDNAGGATDRLRQRLAAESAELTKIQANIQNYITAGMAALSQMPDGGKGTPLEQQLMNLVPVLNSITQRKNNIDISVRGTEMAEKMLSDVAKRATNLNELRPQVVVGLNESNFHDRVMQMGKDLKFNGQTAGNAAGKAYVDGMSQNLGGIPAMAEVKITGPMGTITKQVFSEGSKAATAASGSMEQAFIKVDTAASRMGETLLKPAASMYELKTAADGSFKLIETEAGRTGDAVRTSFDKVNYSLKNSLAPSTVAPLVQQLGSEISGLAPQAEKAAVAISDIDAKNAFVDMVTNVDPLGKLFMDMVIWLHELRTGTKLTYADVLGLNTALDGSGASASRAAQGVQQTTVTYTSAADALAHMSPEARSAREALMGVGEGAAKSQEGTAQLADNMSKVADATAKTESVGSSFEQTIVGMKQRLGELIQKLLDWNATKMEDKHASITVTENRPQAREGLYMPSYSIGTANTATQQSTLRGGGIPAVLHPGEAVIPLSHGRTVPVEIRTLPDRNENRSSGSQSSGGNNTTVNVTIKAEDVDSFKRSQSQIYRDMQREMSRAVDKINK